MRRICAACIAAAVISLPLFGDEKMTIAIIDFRARDLPRADAIRISKMIRNAMINMKFYTVLDRLSINKVMNEHGIQMTGCSDVECAARVGKLLGVRKILTGNVIRVGENLTVTVRVVDVARGIVDSTEKEQTRGKDDIFSMVERLCDKLSLVIAGSVLNAKDNLKKNN